MPGQNPKTWVRMSTLEKKRRRRQQQRNEERKHGASDGGDGRDDDECVDEVGHEPSLVRVRREARARAAPTASRTGRSSAGRRCAKGHRGRCEWSWGPQRRRSLTRLPARLVNHTEDAAALSVSRIVLPRRPAFRSEPSE